MLNPTSAEFGRVDPEQPATETRSPEEQFEARVKAIEDLGTQEAQVLAKGIRGARQQKWLILEALATNLESRQKVSEKPTRNVDLVERPRRFLSTKNK